MQTAQLQTSADNTIKISGALIFATVSSLWEQSKKLFTTPAKQLFFDFDAVTQSDSAGVALLLAWIRIARVQQKEISFLSLPEQMRAIARVSGLEAILPIQ